jgi:3-deoxy-D-manno-octulosonic-acid transferase
VNRGVYSLLWYLATPLLAGYLLWRAWRQPEYLSYWAQRWGWRFAPVSAAPLLWIHAVSVGETRAAAALVDALLERYPKHQLLLTHATPTGRASARQLFSKYEGRVVSAYLPYDYPGAIRRFFARYRPQLGMVMETEVWPNLMHSAKIANVPMLLVNARLSEKSLNKALKRASLLTVAMRGFSKILAQSSADAARIEKLGVLAGVSGNLKFDQAIAPQQLAVGNAWRTAEHTLVTLASAREGEENMLLEALKQLSPTVSRDMNLLLVPRHPQRFEEVAAIGEAKGFQVLRRSAPDWPHRPQLSNASAVRSVLLGDSMGEMVSYYAMSDVVIMGGTLGEFGGQNLIEACACGCPVILGPSRYNFTQACAQAIEGQAAFSAANASEALALAVALAKDPARLHAARSAALAFASAHRGALARTLEAIQTILPPTTIR